MSCQRKETVNPLSSSYQVSASRLLPKTTNIKEIGCICITTNDLKYSQEVEECRKTFQKCNAQAVILQQPDQARVNTYVSDLYGIYNQIRYHLLILSEPAAAAGGDNEQTAIWIFPDNPAVSSGYWLCLVSQKNIPDIPGVAAIQ